MPLEAIVESVPEGQQDFYKEITEGEHKGKFMLDVKPVGGFELDDVSGLRSTLQKFRNEREDLRSQLAEYGDLKPGDIKKKLSRLDELSKLDPQKEAERLAEEKANEKIEQLIERHKGELSKKDELLSKRTRQVHDLKIRQVAQEAIVEHGGNPKLLMPHVESRCNLKEREDGSLAVEVVDENGKALIGDNAGNPMTVPQFVEQMSRDETFSAAFKPKKDGGADSGTDGSDKGGDKGTAAPKGLYRSEMDAESKSKYIEEHGQEAYLKLPDTRPQQGEAA